MLPKPSRDLWKPSGETASMLLVDGPGGFAPVAPPIVPVPGDKQKDPKDKPAIRTEFVIVFVWQEPILTKDNVLGPAGLAKDGLKK